MDGFRAPQQYFFSRNWLFFGVIWHLSVRIVPLKWILDTRERVDILLETVCVAYISKPCSSQPWLHERGAWRRQSAVNYACMDRFWAPHQYFLNEIDFSGWFGNCYCLLGAWSCLLLLLLLLQPSNCRCCNVVDFAVEFRGLSETECLLNRKRQLCFSYFKYILTYLLFVHRNM